MIRKATAADLDSVAEIYDEILDAEADGVSYTNWRKGLYPTKATAQEAFQKGTLYVMEEEGVIGCANLNQIQPVEYAEIPWETEASDAEVLVLHTLCIKPCCSGRGKAREFVGFAEKLAGELGCKAIRLDTYEGNVPTVTMYPKLGYRLAGKTMFHFENVIWEQLNCYEKRIHCAAD